MEIVSAVAGEGLSELVVRHAIPGGFLQVNFTVNTYERVNFKRVDKIFHDINRYWASLPESRQVEIFRLYERILDMTDNIGHPSILQQRLQAAVSQLYQLMPYEEMDHWFRTYGVIEIPATVKEYRGPNDPVDKTYLTSDYVALLSLAMAYRPMVPIFGHYIYRTGKAAVTAFKERLAMTLVGKTWLVRTEAMSRLLVYIEASLSSASISAAAVLGGLGSSELPEWVAALVVVRQLAICYTHDDDRSNVIANIFKYMSEAVSGLDRRYGGMVRDKYPDIGDETEFGDNISKLEEYKIKQDIADGDIVLLSVFTERLDTMLWKTEPAASLEIAELCRRTIAASSDLRFNSVHINLAQWVMAESLSPEGIEHLNHGELMSVMACTQAVLWHWGFYDLAALATALPLKSSGGDTLFLSGDKGAKLNKEVVDRLNAKFRYTRASGKTAKNSDTNYAIRGLVALCEDITSKQWRLCCPSELASKLTHNTGASRWSVPPDLRNQVALLICKVCGA